jgi:uncharacterized protein (TIGR00156 family)
MQKKLLKYTVPLVVLFGVSAVSAQDTSPRPGQRSAQSERQAQSAAPITEAQAVAAAKDGQPAKLRGKIVKQETRNQYLFSDGTGNVLVEIDDKLLNGNKLNAGTQIEIDGKVDTRVLRDPKVEARAVTVLAAGNLAPLNREPGSAPEERG